MLDRTFSNGPHQLRVTYKPEDRIYKGKFMHDSTKPNIYGDTINEVLEIFDDIVNEENKEEN